MKKTFSSGASVGAFCVLGAQSLFGCLCFEPPVCDAFSNASVVFAGKVESQDPSFDNWDPIVSEHIEDVIRNSHGALTEFKRLYASEFPEPARKAVVKASNRKELQGALEQLAKGTGASRSRCNRLTRESAKTSERLMFGPPFRIVEYDSATAIRT
jgi:hypothetical protein